MIILNGNASDSKSSPIELLSIMLLGEMQAMASHLKLKTNVGRRQDGDIRFNAHERRFNSGKDGVIGNSLS